MPNLKDIRKRIGSVKNTQKITGAMKMVAAAKLRRAQDRLVASRPYARHMDAVIKSVAGRVEDQTHPLLEQREQVDNILLIVMSSNRGLCGGFNTNLFRATNQFIREQKIAGVTVDIATVGRKAEGHYSRSGLEIVHRFPDLIGNVTYEKAKELANIAISNFSAGKYDAVYLCYNQFVSAINYNSLVSQLLPLSIDELKSSDNHETNPADPNAIMVGGEYIYEPDVQTLLSQLLPGHIEIQTMQALFESEAAEYGARMTAMDGATNNATDMISRLTLQYNRARQAYITREIVEIVSGAESLKG